MTAAEELRVAPEIIVPPPPKGRGILRRWGEGIVFVAVWTALGWLLGLKKDAYLLLGIPLTIGFQRVVRREPIRATWVREAPPMGSWWIVPAAILAIRPVLALVGSFFYREWVIGGWMMAGAVGSVGAGYALVHLGRSAWRPFVICLLTAGLMGVGLLIAARAVMEFEGPPDWMKALEDLALYFPVYFALEEVSFRGALDSHLHRPGERFGLTSALLGAILWGLWYVPTLDADMRGPGAIASLVVVRLMIGVPLAIAWRRSGNLAVPAFTHALIESVRNALLDVA